MTIRPPRRHRVEAPDGRPIDVSHHAGAAPTLILIHGWACHQGFWRHQAEGFGTGLGVVSVDLAGHGASPPQGTARPSIGALARDIVTVAEALALPEVILLGHSMGGAVALEAAILMPDRCRLVLGVDTFTDAAFYRRLPRPEIVARRRPFEADFSGTMASMVSRIALCGDPEIAASIAAEMSRAEPAVVLAVLEALLDWDIQARWPAVPCPVETINSAALSRGIEPVPGLSNLLVHLMDRVGHFPMLEDPAVFGAAAGAVIRRHLGLTRAPPPSCWS